jgi:hypothetical protein
MYKRRSVYRMAVGSLVRAEHSVEAAPVGPWRVPRLTGTSKALSHSGIHRPAGVVGTGERDSHILLSRLYHRD